MVLILAVTALILAVFLSAGACWLRFCNDFWLIGCVLAMIFLLFLQNLLAPATGREIVDATFG